ncbi:hypothetical protein ACFE04_019849 [Oxalis oulophora]
MKPSGIWRPAKSPGGYNLEAIPRLISIISRKKELIQCDPAFNASFSLSLGSHYNEVKNDSVLMCTMFEAVGQNRKKTSLQLYFERLMQEHPKGAYYSYFQKRIQPILDRKRLEKLERSRVPPTNLPQRLPLLPTSQELARTRKRWKLNAKLIPPSWTKKTNVPSIDTPKYRSSAAYRDRSPEVHQLIFDSDHPSERLQSRVLRNLAPKFISHRMIEFIDEHWNLILVRLWNCFLSKVDVLKPA